MGTEWLGGYPPAIAPYATLDADFEDDDVTESFAWVVPIVHDIVGPVYRYLIRDAQDKAEQVSRLHGAAMMLLLAGGENTDRSAVIAHLRDAAEHVGLGSASFAALHRIVLAELTAVIRMRNRYSLRRRSALEALIMARLGPLTILPATQPRELVYSQFAA
jgi:hypothetical protein